LFALMAVMSRTQTTRLRASRAPLHPGSKIIDAEFEVVGRRHGVVAPDGGADGCVLGGGDWIAVPLVWNFATEIGAFFAQG
jgi:hypothetical protein